MKKTKLLMDMPITVEMTDTSGKDKIFEKVFSYFEYVDNKFSTFKKNSEITKINHNKIPENKYSRDMSEVLKLCEFYKTKTNGYFDIHRPKGQLDPSGLVKGWSIYKASLLLKNMGFGNFYISAGGDMEVIGLNNFQKPWTVGIQHPMVQNQIVKKISLTKGAIVTSGTYERGAHIYNPHTQKAVTDIVSLTVIGPNILEADVYATAAFAMGKEGIRFIGNLKGFAGYMIDKTGLATYTGGFEKYVLNS